MPQGTHHFIGDQVIEAGSTYDKTIDFEDENGVPLEFLTGTDGFNAVNGRIFLRKTADSTGPALFELPWIDFSTAESGLSGIYVLDNSIRVVIEAKDSADLSWNSVMQVDTPLPENRTGVFQCELYDTGEAHTWRVFGGLYEISPEVVRPTN